METRQPAIVLIVDDEPNILRSLRRLLKHEPFRTVATTDPYEALSCLRHEPVAVLITDQRMPELDGDHLIARVKALDERVVCIRLTGYPDSGVPTPTLPPGAVFKTIAKPWNDGEISTAVHEALAHYERAAATADQMPTQP